MYQAAKLGYISQEEAEAYHKQRKKLQARKNYVPQKVMFIVRRVGRFDRQPHCVGY
jgi:hypothetical protein